MYDMHPDHTHHRVQLRQEIVRQGVIAARYPGDLAAIREKIGQMLIVAGERIRGYQPRGAQPPMPPRRAAQFAR